MKRRVGRALDCGRLCAAAFGLSTCLSLGPPFASCAAQAAERAAGGPAGCAAQGECYLGVLTGGCLLHCTSATGIKHWWPWAWPWRSIVPCSSAAGQPPHAFHSNTRSCRIPSAQRKLLSGKAQIIEARVPIIKCKLQFGASQAMPTCSFTEGCQHPYPAPRVCACTGGLQNPTCPSLTHSHCIPHTGGGLAADISLGAENGAHAVDFVRRQVLAVPPLRPLCLAVKAFLRWGGQQPSLAGGACPSQCRPVAFAGSRTRLLSSR